MHIVLLGDSIFDNAAYTRGEPDVVSHLRALVAPAGTATLLAVDGAVTRDVARLVPRVPDTATHLALSVGGNDALGNYDLLNTRVRSTAEALALFTARIETFEQNYAAAVDIVLQAATGRPLALCTIYNGDLGPHEGPIASRALVLFNEVIVRAAFDRGLDVIELRAVCVDPADYANPIEPSGTGGLKIARAIAAWAGGAPPASRIYR